MAQPSRSDAAGAVEAGATGQEHGPGRGDGEPAADDATRPDLIRAAVLTVLHGGLADRPWPDHEDECERCGATDGPPLVHMIHTRTRGTIRAHTECGEAAGYEPGPACTGASDLCGAPAGEPCSPGCPSLAADPDDQPGPVDPDDTDRCPVGQQCESCGTYHGLLIVVTAATSVGVVCLTVCDPCATGSRGPSWSAPDAVRRCLAHAAHLGCTVDDLAIGGRDSGDGR